MKKLFTLITISAIIAFPSFGQEEKMKKLENLENKTVTETKSESKTETNVATETDVKTTSKQDTVIVEVGDEIFSVKEMGDETRIKIGKKQFRIGRYDADQGDTRKVQSFGHHLRAEQNVKVASTELGENFIVRHFAAGGVKVHAHGANAKPPLLLTTGRDLGFGVGTLFSARRNSPKRTMTEEIVPVDPLISRPRS